MDSSGFINITIALFPNLYKILYADRETPFHNSSILGHKRLYKSQGLISEKRREKEEDLL